MVQHLLERGADPDDQGREGQDRARLRERDAAGRTGRRRRSRGWSRRGGWPWRRSRCGRGSGRRRGSCWRSRTWRPTGWRTAGWRPRGGRAPARSGDGAGRWWSDGTGQVGIHATPNRIIPAPGDGPAAPGQVLSGRTRMQGGLMKPLRWLRFAGHRRSDCGWRGGRRAVRIPGRCHDLPTRPDLERLHGAQPAARTRHRDRHERSRRQGLGRVQ